MQHVARRLNDAERATLGQEEVQLGRCFGLGDHLEFEEDAVDRRLLAGLGYLIGYRDQRRPSCRYALADRHIDLPTRAARKV